MIGQDTLPDQLRSADYEKIFAALPPLDSQEYIEYLETASTEELPAQVIVRAYRQLCNARREDAMRATLDRLVDHQYGYLKPIRHLAKQWVPPNQSWHGADDLTQAAIAEMLEVLPTERGALAEVAWVRFSENCLADAWRKHNGRRSEKLTIKIGDKRVPVTFEKSNSAGEGSDIADAENDAVDPIELTDGEAAPWHVGVRPSDVPAIERILKETIALMPDLLMRYIAEDCISEDPSPVSAGTSAGGKSPLTEQTGKSKDQVSRARINVRSRLAAALLASKEIQINREWLRKFLPNKVNHTTRQKMR
jgi:hypothetical protein